MKHSGKRYLKHLLFYLGGDQPPVSWLERVRSVLGGFYWSYVSVHYR